MNGRLKYRFTIARFMPNQVRGEFVNVGVILHVLETQQLFFRWLPKLDRMRCLSRDVTFEQFKHFQKHLAERYRLDSSYITLESPRTVVGEPVNKASPELLDYLYREWSVPFQFSVPIEGFTNNPQIQLDRLYNQMVEFLDETEEEKAPRTRIELVRQKVENQLRKVDLIGPDKITKGIEVAGKTRPWPFDFGRVNGTVMLLQVLPLHQINPIEKSDKAIVFNGHVNDIRERGDYAPSAIKAFAVIHQSKLLERLEGLEEAKRLLEDNKIEIVPENDVLTIAEEIRHFINIKGFLVQSKLS